MYVLAKNQSADQAIFNKHLLPILKNKSQYLHAEGAAQAAFALQEAGIYDQEAWNIIKDAIANKDFNVMIVKNDRWSLCWKTLTGYEHYYQSSVNDFTN